MSQPMASLIYGSIDQSVQIDQLVRATRLVARAAKDEEMREWCETELGGYLNKEIPNYRQLPARIKARDQHRREALVPINKETAAIFSRAIISESIEMVHQYASRENGTYSMHLSPEDAQSIRDWCDRQDLEVFYTIDFASFFLILSAVRNKIFNWANEQENNPIQLPYGITVERLLGITTQPDSSHLVAEKFNEKAHFQNGDDKLHLEGNWNTVNIVNGSPGTTISQTIQPEDTKEISGLISALEKVISESAANGAKPEDLGKLQQSVEELGTLVAMQKPRKGFARAILDGVKDISKTTGSAVAAELVKPYVQTALQAVLNIFR